ncbi:MAG: hypothetical protein ABJA16_12740 [Nakamurella sp.]
MMWYLLLAIPVLVFAMGRWARVGEITATDVHCTSLDRRLDRQAELIREGVAAPLTWMPTPRAISRVGPRPLSSQSGELLAS